MKDQHPKQTKERAQYAENLGDLLWRKACQTMSPEEQELLKKYLSIREMVAVVLPEKIDYNFERVARLAEEAEQLLIACPPASYELQQERLQALLVEDAPASA